VARRATEAYLLQILRHGFLHAGAAENILLLAANSIAWPPGRFLSNILLCRE